MEVSGRRSGSGSGDVVVKKRNSSGCLILRNNKKPNSSSKRPKLVLQESSHDDDELVTPNSLGPDTIRLCTAFDEAEEIDSKRSSKLDVFDFNEYDDVTDAQMLATKKKNHFDHNENRERGGGGAMHAAAATATSGSIDRQFETSSSRCKGKTKNSYFDSASGLRRRPEDSVDHTRRIKKRKRDGTQLAVPLSRDDFNSDASIRVQGKNGVLKVMVNKKNKSAGKPVQRSDDNRKPVVESMHSSRTGGTSKRNAHVRAETKPVGKHGLLVRPKKKHLPARKRLSSMDSEGDEQDSDDSEPSSPDLGMKNAESRKSSKKMVSEDEQKTPKHGKQPSPRTKEVKVKRGRGTEKQKLRERIREMLLNAGWTIDYRPRRNRDYLDAVYINPGGTAYWSIVKAYDALQKQSNDDDGVDHEAKKTKGESSSFSPIADDVLSKLTRNTRKKMEKDLKRKQRDDKRRLDDSESDSGKEPHVKRSAGNRHHKTYMECDSDEEKLSSFMKHGSKSIKTKMVFSKSQNATHHSSDGTEKSLSGSEPHLHGRKIRKQGRCTLLVRSSNKGTNSESDDFVPYMGKRTVLSWLVDSGVVRLSQKVQYRKRKRVLLEGWITRDGIHCGCCSKILTVSKFEIHAGSKLPQPYQNIYLDSGISLLQCQIDAWNRQDNSDKVSFHSVDIDGDDPNDDTCGICGDGGDLICCDGCPSTFHQSCLDIQMLPPGEWHCPNCKCKFCGIAGGTISKEDDATVDALQSCALCEKKYHNSCTKEMDAVPTGSNLLEPYFCGKGCKELFEHLKKYLGTKHELDAGFTWSLIHRTDENFEAASREVSQQVECNSKLAVALNVMDECFLPVIDRRSGINLIHNVLYNSGSNFSRLNYSGFYTAILERGDEIVSAASIRFHGTELAEMPFIGTRHTYRHQGMCRRLFSAIELALCSLKVEKLVIPAISELIHTWTTVFGFTHLEESLRQEMRSLNMLVFPGIDMLQKLLVQQGKPESAEKMENGDEAFNKPKMALGLDMDSTALHDPHESDNASSNPANEINNECSDAAPQELNNDVLVEKTMSSKSSSEERLSDDSISDKCLSPSTTSNGVPEMENKIATSAPVDKLHPSPKCRLSLRNDTLTGPPVDATDCHENPALDQETASFGPDSTENLVEPVADRSRDSSEHDINPVLDSQLENNGLSSKEVDINNPCDEVLPSVILSEEKITEETNENTDISGSVRNHDGESFLPVSSNLNGEIAHEGENTLHLDTEIASNEIHFDETVLNPPGHCSETDPV